MIAPNTRIKLNYPSLIAAGVTNPALTQPLGLTRVQTNFTPDGAQAIVRDFDGNHYRVTVEPIASPEQRLQDAYLTGDMQAVKQAACDMERNTIEQGAGR